MLIRVAALHKSVFLKNVDNLPSRLPPKYRRSSLAYRRSSLHNAVVAPSFCRRSSLGFLVALIGKGNNINELWGCG